MSPGTHTDVTPGDEQRWSPRLIFSLVSIVLLLEVLTLGYQMISIAIPPISAHFHTRQGAWLLTAYLLVGAVTGPPVGKLGDMYGKRKVLLGCVAVSVIGSLICALATSYSMMIAGRLLSGALVSSVFLGYSLIRDVFPAKTVGLAVSIATSGLGLLAVPGPFLTGWLLDNYGFRSIFWVFVVGGIVFGAMIAVSTPESRVRMRSRIDVVGAVLLGAGIGGVLVALSFGSTWGWSSGSTIVFLLGGIVLIAAWYISARVVREPLLDPKVLFRRSILLTSYASAATYGSSALITILLPMLTMTPAVLGLGYGFGVSADGYAVFQAPLAGMVVVGGAVAGLLVGRTGRSRVLMIIGTLVVATTFVLLAMEHTDKALLFVFAGIAGAGMGLGYAATPNLLIEAVPAQLQASTASLVNVVQNIVTSALPVIVFAVLNNSYIAALPQTVTRGATLYSDNGFRAAFLIGAAVLALGAVAAAAIPRRIVRLPAPSPVVHEDAVVLSQ